MGVIHKKVGPFKFGMWIAKFGIDEKQINKLLDNEVAGKA
jgi:hypothetical protein